MQLSGAACFPSEADLDKGLPHNDWQAILAQPTRQEAKVKWIAEQLRLANQELRHAEARVKAKDAALLRRMRAEGVSPAMVRRKAKELEASRKQRIRRRQDEARDDVDQYRAYLAKETAALEKMRKPATQPTGEGG